MAPPKGGVRTDLSMRFSATGPMSSWNNGSVVFSPGVPLQPISEQPVRAWDFPVNVNSVLRPRAYEPFGFEHLKAFSNVELVRLAIETRKDQFERLDWQIKPTDEAQVRKLKKTGPDSRIQNITKFWRKPDQTTPFATWMRLLLENLLVLDAAALECRRTFGGQLIGLDVIPGETIHPMVDDTGRRPRGAGEVAYQQVIKGVAWADLEYTDLIYAPRNPRPNHNYGFGPVEQIIVTITTVMNRQARQLAYFTESNVPAGILNGPEGWSPQQIEEMQVWLDAKLSGMTDEQVKLLFMPAGTKYQSFKDSPLKDDFDEWLARIVAYAFSLPPTPFIKQMNRSTGQTDQDRSEEEGLEPLKLWAKRLIDGVIQDDMGCDDLEFVWVDTPSIDPKIQADIDDKNLRNGSATLDEVRDARGDDPYPDGLGAKPMIVTSTGAVTLEQVAHASDMDLNPPEPPSPMPQAPGPQPAPGAAQAGSEQPPEKAPQAQGGKPDPHAAKDTPAEKLAKGQKLITAQRPKARRAAASLEKAVTPILAKAGDHAAAEIARKLRGLHKAADDGTVANGVLSQRLADAVDLSALDDLTEAVFEDLFEIAFDSAQLALSSVDGPQDDGVFEQINERAVAYAKQRAAEMVSVDGDKNLIDSSRIMIRDVIAKGLADNIGADKIADAIQESMAFSAERADLIAKTEIAMANGAGKQDGWQAATDSGIELEAYWQISNNDNCCDDCQANEDASPIPFGEAFPSGDTNEPVHPRCECVTYAQPLSTGSGAEDDAADD